MKTSPLGADLEHLGDRLAIFVDRVELRDRLDRVRNSISADDIVDVTVQKRLTGAVLTVESVARPGHRGQGSAPRSGRRGPPTHLRKDADGPTGSRARTTKLLASCGTDRGGNRRHRRRRPEDRPGGPSRKLADLHNAGVLTDEEYQQKLLVVRRLADGETLSTPRR